MNKERNLRGRHALQGRVSHSFTVRFSLFKEQCALGFLRLALQLQRAARRYSALLLCALFTLSGFLVMGYHPGAEDDGVYLAAIKSNLTPDLFPHDASFFRMQLQATVFDTWIASLVRYSGIPLAWAELLIQFLSIFLILWAARRIAQVLVADPFAQWAGVAMLAAMFTIPVAGTALYIADQHLHPRNIATALIMTAIAQILHRRGWLAAPFVVLAFCIHPIMGLLGISFTIFLALAVFEPAYAPLRLSWRFLLIETPLAWIFTSPSPAWRQALQLHTYFFLFHWEWYEWLGALGPLVIFMLLWRHAKRRGKTRLSQLSLAIACYGIFQQAIALTIASIPALVRLIPLQPMRYLQLIYALLALVGGCLLGQHLLKHHLWRWAIFLLLANGCMFLSQRELFAASPHLELPWTQSSNPWLQAFAWIRTNTPHDAYFVVDPDLLAAPGEDYHSFRALAERSQLADAIKDAAVVTQVPDLAPRWQHESEAQAHWKSFHISDYERLKKEFGVDWVLTDQENRSGLVCLWQKETLAICRIP